MAGVLVAHHAASLEHVSMKPQITQNQIADFVPFVHMPDGNVISGQSVTVAGDQTALA